MLTHKQHGNGSDTGGFGPKVNLTVRLCGINDEAGLLGLTLFARGPLDNPSDLRFRLGVVLPSTS